MDSAPPPPGPSAQPLSSAHAQLSPDGQWRWDGFVWQPTTLPDATLQPNAPTSTGPQATFTLNYTETKAALDWLVKRKDQMLVRIICALFLIGVGAQELLNHANGGLFLGALGVYALGRFAYRVYVTIPRAATKLTTPPDPQRLIFTESGLQTALGEDQALGVRGSGEFGGRTGDGHVDPVGEPAQSIDAQSAQKQPAVGVVEQLLGADANQEECTDDPNQHLVFAFDQPVQGGLGLGVVQCECCLGTGRGRSVGLEGGVWECGGLPDEAVPAPLAIW